MTKTEARAQAKALRKNLDLHAIGAAMTQQLFALPAWRQAGTVFCFVSMRDEPDTTAILQQALVSGKRLCVPRCLPGNDGRMELVEITSLNDLQPGRYGILEPCGGRTIAALEPGALALIPCLAVDKQGVRLGRGAGYYDRFLTRFGQTGPKLLLCPEALVFPALPTDEWDVPFPPPLLAPAAHSNNTTYAALHRTGPRKIKEIFYEKADIISGCCPAGCQLCCVRKFRRVFLHSAGANGHPG